MPRHSNKKKKGMHEMPNGKMMKDSEMKMKGKGKTSVSGQETLWDEKDSMGGTMKCRKGGYCS